jgi:nicotinate-nucleotide--dimethylbenzimidazole phosphoribosyltransferase
MKKNPHDDPAVPHDFSAIPSPSLSHIEAAWVRQSRLTKPKGSLGMLEEIAVQCAGFQKTVAPMARPASVLIFAADHPVTEHQVSPYPAEVTAAMVKNFERGGAAAAVLSRHARLPLTVVDAGVFGGAFDAEYPEGDLLKADTLDSKTWQACLELGRRAARETAAENKVLLLGEMGIGNTTLASAVAAALLLESSPADLVGAGTGAHGAILENKISVVEKAIARVGTRLSPEEALRRLGGREMAALYGAMSQALSQRCVVLVDGFIVSVVAAVLLLTHPQARAGLIFAHRSEERGHALVLALLGVRPLLDVKLRLGEASGALAAFSLLEQACLLHNEMATFESAQVPEEAL